MLEFLEYTSNMPLVDYLHEQQIDYKAKIFFSQLPFRDEELDIALYGLIEQRGFSEDAAYRNRDNSKVHDFI